MANYFDTQETRDERILKSFNEKTQMFTQITYHKKGSEIDVEAIDKKGRKCHIEIKERTDKYKDFELFKTKFDNIYLETGKLNALRKIMQSGYPLNEQELFINIFDDGDTIVIHNLNEPQEMIWMPNKRIYNRGLNKMEYEHRLGVLIKNAIIYKYDRDMDNYKRIQ